MGILNDRGDRLARSVQRTLVRAGMRDVSVIAADPPDGRRLVLRRGHALHRLLVTPLRPTPADDWLPEPGGPDWTPLYVASSFVADEVWHMAEQGRNFLDEEGNANLDLDGEPILFSRARDVRSPIRSIDIRPTHPGPSDLELGRTGHQVAFVLLCEPELADASMRTLAETAGVSLGTAHGVVRSLTDQGYIRKGRVRRAGQLLDEWTAAFRRTSFEPLTPRPLFAEDDSWVDALLRHPGHDALIGGSAAGVLLTNALRATDGLVYVRMAGPIVSLLRLKPTPSKYPVDLRKRFWGDAIRPARPGIAPSVLVYGDLLWAGDQRSAEAAEHLREHDAHLRLLDAL